MTIRMVLTAEESRGVKALGQAISHCLSAGVTCLDAKIHLEGKTQCCAIGVLQDAMHRIIEDACNNDLLKKHAASC
jgi:hypothetical protein